jgi:putative flippase GtrA
MRSEAARFVRFGVVGLSNTLLTLLAFALLTRAGVVADAASALGFLAGAVNGYLLNRAWTFRAEGHAGVHAWRFTLLNAATLAASTLIVFVLVDCVGYPELAVWLPLTLAILATHYLGMKHWAFAQRT